MLLGELCVSYTCALFTSQSLAIAHACDHDCEYGRRPGAAPSDTERAMTHTDMVGHAAGERATLIAVALVQLCEKVHVRTKRPGRV